VIAKRVLGQGTETIRNMRAPRGLPLQVRLTLAVEPTYMPKSRRWQLPGRTDYAARRQHHWPVGHFASKLDDASKQ
jgi:hypothetical protein